MTLVELHYESCDSRIIFKNFSLIFIHVGKSLCIGLNLTADFFWVRTFRSDASIPWLLWMILHAILDACMLLIIKSYSLKSIRNKNHKRIDENLYAEICQHQTQMWYLFYYIEMLHASKHFTYSLDNYRSSRNCFETGLFITLISFSWFYSFGLGLCKKSNVNLWGDQSFRKALCHLVFFRHQNVKLDRTMRIARFHPHSIP